MLFRFPPSQVRSPIHRRQKHYLGMSSCSLLTQCGAPADPSILRSRSRVSSCSTRCTFPLGGAVCSGGGGGGGGDCVQRISCVLRSTVTDTPGLSEALQSRPRAAARLAAVAHTHCDRGGGASQRTYGAKRSDAAVGVPAGTGLRAERDSRSSALSDTGAEWERQHISSTSPGSWLSGDAHTPTAGATDCSILLLTL